MPTALAPALFVLLWSSGFVVARLMVPHAAPELIIAVRLLLTMGLLGAAAAVARQPWPRGRRLGLHLLAGALLNGCYFCLSWGAIAHGMPAGVMSLLGSVQPLVVAVASFVLWRERLGARAWLGLAIALAGVVCVLGPLILRGGTGAGVSALVIVAGVMAILAMAAGTMIQRSELGSDPIIVSGAVQNGGGALVGLVAMLILGDFRWDGDLDLWLGLGWSVLILSVGGLSLLMWLVRHQGATRVSVLLLLVPPLAAVEAWALFGERLVAIQVLGFVLALAGVLLARAQPRAERLAGAG